jgi:hypothetical protein
MFAVVVFGGFYGDQSGTDLESSEVDWAMSEAV